MSLGVYPHISLQEARERAAECRNLLKQGTNPGAKRRDDKLRQQEAGLNTFRRAWSTGTNSKRNPAAAARR